MSTARSPLGFKVAGDTSSYLVAVAPLVVAQLLICPTDHVPIPLPFSPLRLPSTVLHRDFVASGVAMREGRWHTAVTHMLVHASAGHLLANLQGLCLSGYAVWSEFGQAGLTFAFLGGGAFASMDRLSLRSVQVERELLSVANPLTDVLPAFCNPLIDVGVAAANKTANFVSPFWAEHVRYIGSSAGVMSIMGIELALTIEQLVDAALTLCASGKVTIHAGNLASNLTSVYVTARYLYNEWQRLEKGDEWGVDHAGHLNGLVFGLGCYATWRVTAALRRRGVLERWRRRAEMLRSPRGARRRPPPPPSPGPGEWEAPSPSLLRRAFSFGSGLEEDDNGRWGTGPRGRPVGTRTPPPQ